MEDSVRVYLGSKGGDAPVGATVLEALRKLDSAGAAAVESGTRLVVDSRGLPISVASKVHGGMILRLVSARANTSAAADDGDVQPPG